MSDKKKVEKEAAVDRTEDVERDAETAAQESEKPEPDAAPADKVSMTPDGDFPAGTLGVDDLVPGLAEIAESEAIAQLEAERDGYRDKLLRALAESENVRRRAERDRKDAETYGGTKLARDLLAVHDNLDRALSHVDDALREQAKGFIEGVELTQRELLNAFAKHKIEKVNPAIGEKFDPNRHQAMFEAPVPGAEPGTVIEVMQAGFIIADRLLRPALVGVARAAPKAAPEAGSDDAEPETAGAGPDGKTSG